MAIILTNVTLPSPSKTYESCERENADHFNWCRLCPLCAYGNVYSNFYLTMHLILNSWLLWLTWRNWCNQGTSLGAEIIIKLIITQGKENRGLGGWIILDQNWVFWWWLKGGGSSRGSVTAVMSPSWP